MINSSRSPLSTPINAAEPCSLPKGCPPFYFCHRRNVIKLKLVDLEQQVYLHTVLSNCGSKLTDRPSYLNHTCRILQPKILFPNFMHNFIIIIHIIPSTLKALRVISIKFLLEISMLCKTECSWELWTWSHNLLDILSTSSHYFCRKWIGATNEHSNFDLRVKRVLNFYF